MTDLADLDAFTAVLQHTCIRHRFASGVKLVWEFERGEIVRIVPTGRFLYYPSQTHMPPPLRAFVDFIKRPIP